ncbi:hypothetical protein ACX3YG_12070 [Pseudomonas wadenswilerensis]
MSSNGPIVIEINPRLGGLYVSSAFIDVAELNPWEIYLDLLFDSSRLTERLLEARKRVNDCADRFAMMALYPDTPGRYRQIVDTSILQSRSEILEFAQLEDGTVVTSETEEHYLLKCWARVENSIFAEKMYSEISNLIRPTIEQGLPREPK